MTTRVPGPLVIRQDDVLPVSRGEGATTLPYVGKWSPEIASFTTGTTTLAPGKGIPLHEHNVEEFVFVMEGNGEVRIDGETTAVSVGAATWIPPKVPHRFVNTGSDPMKILWVYDGLSVTRTISSTGRTVEHLSAADRGTTTD